MSTDDFDDMAPGDEELLAGLHRSVAGATLATSAADVVALGRRTRNRHRALAAGIGTSAAAVVAAIGVLAPTAGTGAGTTTNAIQKAVMSTSSASTSTSGGAQTLNVQDAGFTVEEYPDGTVHLTLKEIFDPAALKATLDKAGVPSAVLTARVSENMVKGLEFQCTPDPGVHFGGTMDGHVITPSRTAGAVFDIHKSRIPAGDFVTVTRFQTPDGQSFTGVTLTVGQQKDCVPEIVDHDPAVH